MYSSLATKLLAVNPYDSCVMASMDPYILLAPTTTTLDPRGGHQGCLVIANTAGYCVSGLPTTLISLRLTSKTALWAITTLNITLY